MKINVGLIGKGNWGLRIKKKLNKIANLQFTCGKKKNYLSEIKLKNIKWIFIATPNHTHYQIVKQCLQNGVNVFCEKPLCLSYNKAQRLINFARSKKLKLYVSDLYDFYSNKINKLNNLNYIYRSKYVSGKDNEFFYRFMYHDISILYNFLKKNSLTNCVIRSYKKKKIF